MSIPALLPDPSSSGLTAHRCLCPAEQPGKQSTAAPWERAGTGPLSRAGSGRGKLRAAGTVRAPGRSGRGGGSHSPACSSGHSPVAPTHLLALVCRQPVGQEGAESALAHAALAGQNQHHVLHAPQPLPQRRRLRCGVARPQSATTGPRWWARPRPVSPAPGTAQPRSLKASLTRVRAGGAGSAQLLVGASLASGGPARLDAAGPRAVCNGQGELGRGHRRRSQPQPTRRAPHPPAAARPPRPPWRPPHVTSAGRRRGGAAAGRVRGRAELSLRGEGPGLRRRRSRSGRA